MSAEHKWEVTTSNGKAIVIYGANDDLVELEGGVEDGIGCYQTQAVIEVGGGDGGVRVLASYAVPGGFRSPGVWRIALEPIDEDVPLLPVRVSSETGRSVAVVIDAPAGCPVRWTTVSP